MRDIGQPAAEIIELGVVDPIGVPGWLRRPFARLPRLARLFLALAVVDTVVRAFGIMEPRVMAALDAPLVTIATVLPRVLWIAFPAIILRRRPDAARSTPWIFRGAVLLAVATLVVRPVASIVEHYSYGPYQFALASTVIVAAGSITFTAAWLMLAKGLAALRQRPPTASAAALSSLIAVAFLLGAGVSMLPVLTSTGADLDPESHVASSLLNLLNTIANLATACALWVIARGLGDPLRPRRAVRAAVAAATVWASATALASIAFTALIAVQPAFESSVDPLLFELSGYLSWVAFVVAPSLLIYAFAIGLADADAADEAPTR